MSDKAVNIFLPTCGEALSLLDNTYHHVDALVKNYSPNPAFVFVLDDSKREEVKELAAHYGFIYLSRPDAPLHKKAGNLRYAFNLSTCPFILILDADFCPHPTMLDELISKMEDPEVAIAQSPQFFSSTTNSWLANAAASVQELFYRIIQPARNTLNAPICVGSCALYRRSALKPFGGTALINYSEDVHTGFFLQEAGWRVLYTPKILSKGICPDTLSDFFNQQYRWCMGSLTLMTNPLFWKGRLTTTQKLCYISGMLYYLSTAINALTSQLAPIAILLVAPHHVKYYSISFTLPSLLISTLGMKFWSRTNWTIDVLTVRHIQGFSHLFALVDKLRGNMLSWVPTNASGSFKHTRFKIFYYGSGCLTLFKTLTICILSATSPNAVYDTLPTMALSIFTLFVALRVYQPD